MDNKKSAALRQGALVFIALAVLTAVEYGIAISINNTLLLFVALLIKAVLVVYFYMHVSRVLSPEEGGH
jgi:cytochrome c oxidase subunit 4